MRLILHSDSACSAVRAIDVIARRGKAGHLSLAYRTSGIPLLPRSAACGSPQVHRADDLWRHTCFEAFLRPPEGESYVELNFSPSLQWAAYRFDDYRVNRRIEEGIGPPAIQISADGGGFELQAEIDLGRVDDFAGTWRVGLSAVIEDADGNISYWALAHPPGKADFHNGHGFALELPAT